MNRAEVFFHQPGKSTDGEIHLTRTEFDILLYLSGRPGAAVARETLLAQASDWPFLLRAGKSGSFARRQIEDAVTNFNRIYEMLCANTVGTEWLTRLEKRNNIFPNINYRVFRHKR